MYNMLQDKGTITKYLAGSPTSYPSHSIAFMVLLTSEIQRIGIKNGCTDRASDFTVNPILTNFPSKGFDCAPKFVNLKDVEIKKLCP